MTEQKVQVAIAILYRDGKFLSQLRDNIAGIVYPGHWGLFGGHLEAGETPEIALLRELEEEIGYTPPWISLFGLYQDERVIRHVFLAPLSVEPKDLVLKEGWDMKLLTPTEIQAGCCYSEKAGMVCSLGKPHQRILLDFIDQNSDSRFFRQ